MSSHQNNSAKIILLSKPKGFRQQVKHSWLNSYKKIIDGPALTLKSNLFALGRDYNNNLQTSMERSRCCVFLSFSISLRNLLSFTGNPPSSLMIEPGSEPTSSQNMWPNICTVCLQRPTSDSYVMASPKNVILQQCIHETYSHILAFSCLWSRWSLRFYKQQVTQLDINYVNWTNIINRTC